MVSPRVLTLWIVPTLLLVGGFEFTLTSASEPEDLVFFETKIRPVLVEHCYSCHSVEAKDNNKLKGGLLLDTRQGLLSGGDSGPAVKPKAPAESLLISALMHEDFEMPPTGKLAPGVIQDFTDWVQKGAFDPRDGDDNRSRPTIDYEASAQFWSFQAPKATNPPPHHRRSLGP